jgi:hypothetical protein
MTDKQKGLRFGPLGKGAIHLCVDMQRMFDSGSPWQTVWLRKVLPQVFLRDPSRTNDFQQVHSGAE